MTCAQISNVTANYCRAEEYEQRIAQLEAENAALLDRISAEAGLRVDTEAERDTALDNLRAADKELRAKDELWHQNIAFTYEIMKQRDAARQSRARLVGLVRHLRAWFSATAPDSAFVKRITDERDSLRGLIREIMGDLCVTFRTSEKMQVLIKQWDEAAAESAEAQERR